VPSWDGSDPALRKLFGQSLHNDGQSGPAAFLKEFCLNTLPWYYLNRYDRLSYVYTPDAKEVHFSDDLITCLQNDGQFSIKHKGILLQDNNDVCIPALWRQNKELIAYSSAGYKDKKWQLPDDWKNIGVVDIYEITEGGLNKLGQQKIENGQLVLSLKPCQEVCILPSGSRAE
jgi:hypothetical protein